jgi:hypothetical protein
MAPPSDTEHAAARDDGTHAEKAATMKFVTNYHAVVWLYKGKAPANMGEA